MPKTAAPIAFIVRQSQAVAADTARGAAAAPLPAGLSRGRRKQLVQIGAQRGAGAETRVEAVPGEDVVVLHIAGGPALVLHPETARALMLAQSDAKQTRGATAASVTAGGVDVPANLHWVGLDRPATRGWLGNVILSAVEVLTGLAKDPAADLVAAGVVKRVDAQVDAGVYQLDAATLPPLKGRTPLAKVPAGDAPALVLLHGTFSNTSGTFGKLWTQHPQRVRELFARYKGRVYGLDHPTLGVSPIENALALAETLPRDATLHLLSHSRGGLVAEVLARVCAAPDMRPGDLAPFAGAAYQRQRDALQRLAATVRQRRIQVERLVRVACPARGTLLASKRLDAYLSVFKWTLELAGAPVLPELVDFLGEVAQRRTDPTVIPGLAAQMPDSPLVQWLHAVEEPIPGSLRVIAGDIEGDSVVSWLKTLLADAFYWTDHDLVVQTRSMYGGAPRRDGATFVFDQGGAVSHFNYFGNVRTADAITDALVQDSPAGFRTIGPLSWAGDSATGARGVDRGAVRAADDGTPPEQKPAVFILPGILGSNLKIGKDRIWLGWRLVNGLQRLAYRQGAPDGVEPDGPIGMYYDDLGRFLAHSHQVIEFAFDWRKPMEEEARRLADEVDKALTARQASGMPVRVLAHSMGGVLARTMQLERPGTWDKMMQRDGARLLMLGTPNAGSWAPMQVLSGDDTFGNLLVTVGAPFKDKAARELMARLPGFLQLQASLRDPTLDLGSSAQWATLAAEDLKRLEERSWWHNLEVQLGAYAWGVPPQPVLDRAVALRQRLDDQLDTPPTGFPDKLAMVIGRADFTPDGYEIGADGLVYRNAPDHGDGRVTLASALLSGVPTWAVNCVHGSLPDFKDGFAGYLDLLETGKTDKLTLWSEGRGLRDATAPAASYVRSRPAHDSASAPPPEDQRTVVVRQARPRPAGAPRDAALRITVRNGDLSFVHEPLLLGHYQSLRLTGTEYVMDRLIGGQMKGALAVGHYPEAAGEHAIFLNTRAPADDPRQLPRPQAVVVVGLGEEGKLRASDLVRAVRQATIGWLLRAAERGDAPVEIDLAATLIGSGGSGIAVGQSAQLIAQGVREANERLHDANQRWRRADSQRSGEESGRGTSWPLVGHLFLTELYLDRATEAWRALRVQARATPSDYVLSDTVQQGTGALERPLDSGYRGADYDFISAIAEPDPQGDARIAYTLDTRRARSEVRAQKTQGRLLRELVASGSTDQNGDPQIGSTLFKLLIPVEMEPFFGGSTEMQLELNDGTAGIPWELLDTDSDGGDPRPWAIRAKLLRKLRTVEFRAKVHDASPDGGILVIGEPEASPEAGRNVIYPRLPGAREEAKAVAALFSQQRRDGRSRTLDEVRSLISPDDPARVGPDARTVMNALMERDRVWRIIHIAGHGEPPDQVGADPTDPNDRGQGPGNPRGVVLSGGTYLGPREIAALRVVPELVFVNCCYLGARPTASVLDVDTPGYLDDRAQFAAGVAEKLIEIGVRCVIAAGWAVGDAPAKEFARTFYGALLADPPARFIDAVAQAREAARALGGNTWAAYQCYGDPDWILRRDGSDPQAPPPPLEEEFDAVASSDGLQLALRTLEIRSQYQHAAADEQRSKIHYLESRFASQWGGRGSVAEAFGAAWSAAQVPDAAIAWYRRALAANDGTASLKAAEQLGNLEVRQAWAAAKRALPAPTPPPASTTRKRGGRGAATRGAGQPPRAGALKTAGAAIDRGFAQLQRVAAIEPSVERLSLCGSAWKRQAMVARLAGDRGAERAALEKMRDWYARAEKLARQTGDPGLFYPALNRIAAAVAGAAGRTVALDDADLESVRQNLAARNRDDPDFWSVAALTELRMYEALARRELAKALPAIEREYDDLYRRCDADWLWKSVSDQADFVLSIYAAAATDSEPKAAQSLRQSLAKKARV